MLCINLFASDDGNDLYIYGLSYHTNRNYNWHEINPGLGYGHYWVQKDADYLELTSQGSVYNNSYGHWTGVVTIGPRWILGERKSFNYFVSINAGFICSEDYTNMIVIPMFGVGYSRVSINSIFIPKPRTNTSDDVSNAIGMFLGWKF